MSIAVSAVVQPSRILLFIVIAMVSLCLSIGLYFAVGMNGSIPIVARVVIPLFSLCGAIAVCSWIKSYRLPYRIDILESGHVRFFPSGTLAQKDVLVTDDGTDDAFFHVLPTSTTWSSMLVLNLRSDDGLAATAVILPDCLTPESFREISVACRWISGRGDHRVEET